jgi:hypothetical protein
MRSCRWNCFTQPEFNHQSALCFWPPRNADWSLSSSTAVCPASKPFAPIRVIFGKKAKQVSRSLSSKIPRENCNLTSRNWTSISPAFAARSTFLSTCAAHHFSLPAGAGCSPFLMARHALTPMSPASSANRTHFAQSAWRITAIQLQSSFPAIASSLPTARSAVTVAASASSEGCWSSKAQSLKL